MKLSTLLVLAVGATSLVACGGTSPEDACRDQAAVQCERMWTCDSPVKFGDDASSCVTSYQALCALAGDKCPDGKSFNSKKADECTAAIKAQSCESYNSDTEPAVCEQACE